MHAVVPVAAANEGVQARKGQVRINSFPKSCLLYTSKMIKLDLYLFSVGITTVIQQIALDQHPVLIGYRWLKPDITDSVVPDSINPHTIQINSVRWKKFIPVSYTHLDVYKRQGEWCISILHFSRKLPYHSLQLSGIRDLPLIFHSPAVSIAGCRRHNSQASDHFQIHSFSPRSL